LNLTAHLHPYLLLKISAIDKVLKIELEILSNSNIYHSILNLRIISSSSLSSPHADIDKKIMIVLVQVYGILSSLMLDSSLQEREIEQR
jgi:hypothetical protein